MKSHMSPVVSAAILYFGIRIPQSWQCFCFVIGVEDSKMSSFLFTGSQSLVPSLQICMQFVETIELESWDYLIACWRYSCGRFWFLWRRWKIQDFQFKLCPEKYPNIISKFLKETNSPLAGNTLSSILWISTLLQQPSEAVNMTII